MKAPEELRAEVHRLLQMMNATHCDAAKTDLAEQALKPAQEAEFAEREPQKLRQLASWYREFAERAGSSAIWERRLLMAEALEKEADIIEGKDNQSGFVCAD